MKKQKLFKVVKRDKEFTPERALKLAGGIVILGATASILKNL